jgi:hypothetical protein
MDISREKAEYTANKVNDLISEIYKKMCDLQQVMESETYEAIIDSDDTKIIEMRDEQTLPLDFMDFLDQLPEMF